MLVERFSEYDDTNRMGSAARAKPVLDGAGVEVLERDFFPDPDLTIRTAQFDVVMVAIRWRADAWHQ